MRETEMDKGIASFLIYGEQRQQLKTYVAAKNVTQSEVIRKALNQYLGATDKGSRKKVKR